jgi:hypothetical protein
MKSLLLCLLYFIPAAIYAQQIPVIDGVIGGVPKVTSKAKPAVLDNLAVTPGKLRFKENTGICGAPIFNKYDFFLKLSQ